MTFLQKNTFFYSAGVSSASSRFRILIFFTYPTTQFNSRSSKRVVAISPISFTFLKLRVTKCVKIIFIVYVYISHKTARVVRQPLLQSQGRGYSCMDDQVCVICLIRALARAPEREKTPPNYITDLKQMLDQPTTR